MFGSQCQVFFLGPLVSWRTKLKTNSRHTQMGLSHNNSQSMYFQLLICKSKEYVSSNLHKFNPCSSGPKM